MRSKPKKDAHDRGISVKRPMELIRLKGSIVV